MNGQNQNNDKDYIIKELSRQIDELKTDLSNDDISILIQEVKSIKNEQNKLIKDVRELRDIIRDPENGVIVKVNKNTEYREMLEAQEDDNIEILEQHQSLVKFKENVTKLLWLITGAIISIITKIFFFGK